MRRFPGSTNRRRLLEDLVDSFERSAATLHQIHNPTEGDHGPDQHTHVGVEHDETADRNAMPQHVAAAHPQNKEKSGPNQDFENWLEDRLNPDELQILRDILAVQLGEAAHFRALLHEGADHSDAGKILLDTAGNVGEQLLDFFKTLVNDAAGVDHRNAYQGRRQNRIERKVPIG